MLTKTDTASFLLTLKRAIPRYAPELDEATAGIWHDALSGLEPKDLQAAYLLAIRRCDSFPSIKAILEFAGLGERSIEDVARDVGERIYGAIASRGDLNGNGESAKRKWDLILATIGPIGAEVVRLAGGWNRLCEITTGENAPTLKAQWRELAAVIARRGVSSLPGPLEISGGPTRAALEGLGNVISLRPRR